MKTNNQFIALSLYLHDFKLSMGNIFVLHAVNRGEVYPSKHKLYKDLDKGGFVYGGKITDKGKKLLEVVKAWGDEYEGKEIKVEKVEYSEQFEHFWGLYPTSDGFEYKGKIYNPTRKLKTTKKSMLAKYNKAINSGKITHDGLVKALEAEIFSKKEESIKKGINKMSFFANSDKYFNQEKWSVWENVDFKRGEENGKTVKIAKVEF